MYCPTIARVGELVDALEESGMAAVGYHGQMDAASRRVNQEKWMAEEVHVLVGTIAFGLGINKPNVRAVIRLGMPDSIEQFYQETGRAGRDGLPADCFLFWQKKDNALRAFFINQMGDAREKDRAWQRYHRMQDFVAANGCRQKAICEHFGETVKWNGCGVCDNCSQPPAWLARLAHSRAKSAPRSAAAPSLFQRESDSPADEELREFLREWRKNTAREKMVAAFVVLHDSTLEELCRRNPKTMPDLRAISGMGEKKCEAYGEEILRALRRFEKGERASQDWHRRASDPSRETLELLAEGRTFQEIAQLRGRKVSSVISLVANLVEMGEVTLHPDWVDSARAEQIRQSTGKLGFDLLKPIKESLPAEITYEDIRLVVAGLRYAAKSVAR